MNERDKEIQARETAEQTGRVPEGLISPEKLSRYYPIPGEYLMSEIREAKREELPGVVDEFLAMKEGLKFGSELWDLEDKQQLLFLYNLFTTVENGMDRPSLQYPEQELELRFENRSYEIKKGAKKRKEALTSEETDEIKEIARLVNFIKARAEFDMAFVQRMDTCEVAEVASELLNKDSHYRKSVKPDRGTWEALFEGEFGDRVDKVLRKIVAYGTPQDASHKVSRQELFPGEFQQMAGVSSDIYVEKIGETPVFKMWLNNLLQVAEGRMDVVWMAWRIALTWELPAEFGVSIGPENEGSKYKIAEPPIGNDYFTWAMHSNEKRALEFGWNSKHKRITNSKFLSHSGFPISIGHIPKIQGSYLHESEITDEVTKKKKSLWELWWKEGKILSNLPWFQTETDSISSIGELPPASYGGWLLKRTRAWPVIKDLRSTPSLKEIGDEDFFWKKVRFWGKVFGDCNDNVEPEKNPRTMWTAGLLLAHYSGRSSEIPLTQGKAQDLILRDYYPGETMGFERAGEGERRSPSISEIFDRAIQSSFLRQKDVDWLKEKLKIKIAVL